MKKDDLGIIVSVFGGLSSKGLRGVPYFNYHLSKHFHDHGNLVHAYCMHKETIEGIPESKVTSVYTKPLLNLFFKTTKLLKSWFPNFQKRAFDEYVYDLYVSRIIKFKHAKVLVILKPVAPFTSTKARKAGLEVITLATVAHPVFIRNMIKKLESRYQVRDKSTYSFNFRIKRLCKTLEMTTKVVPKTPSKFIERTYLENKIKPENFALLESNSNLDFNVFAPSSQPIEHDRIQFLTVGVFNLKKGIPLLLDAWNMLTPDEAKSAHLKIVGKIESSTKEVIDKIPIDQNNVEFIDHVHQINQVYQKAQVFICSSISDLLPKTIMEALATGLPVIASTQCGYADLIENEVNGFLYDPFDTDELRKHISWFLAHPHRIKEMGDTGRNRILAADDTSNFQNEFLKLCHSIVSNKQVLNSKG